MTRNFIFLMIPIACLTIAIPLMRMERNGIQHPAALARNIQYRFHLQNTTNQPISPATFFVYAPVKQTQTQRCTAVQTSHPYTLKVDGSGNQLMIFSFAEIPPYSTKVISIHACLEICNTPADSYPDSGASAASVDLSGACEKKKVSQSGRTIEIRHTPENRGKYLSLDRRHYSILGIFSRRKRGLLRIHAKERRLHRICRSVC